MMKTMMAVMDFDDCGEVGGYGIIEWDNEEGN